MTEKEREHDHCVAVASKYARGGCCHGEGIVKMDFSTFVAVLKAEREKVRQKTILDMRAALEVFK